MKNPFVIMGIFIVLFIGAGIWYERSKNDIAEKIYVAVEGEGKIAVLDAQSRKVIKDIHLYVDHDGETTHYTPHNVEVAPDGKSVWAAGNVGGHDHSLQLIQKAHANGDDHPVDSVFVINPIRDTIITVIPLGEGVGTAHVTLTPDSKYAYVTAQKEGAIYKIDVETYKIMHKIVAREGSEPHGIRIAKNNTTGYIAFLKGAALGILDLSSDEFSEIKLRGQAVQVGVTANGKYAVASLYDTKELVILDTTTSGIRYVTLPGTSRGPIQMYATPDSKYVYLADQGYYFGMPQSEWVYKIDLEAGEVVKEVKGGKAPHGVAMSPDGSFVYVTNLLGGDVSVIDTNTDVEVERIPVGAEPNGVSVWKNYK